MATSLSSSVLRSREVAILTAERKLAAELGEALRAFESSAQDAERLREVTQSLSEPFLLVVAGEFNAGKSAFINALVGEQALAEGVTPTTAHVTLLRYGETARSHLRPDGIEEIWRPSAFLRDTAIVDTPGTNAVLRHHEQLTTEFIPRSDFILFVTSADRPFTESERQFLERIRGWGKKVVLVLNKVDLLRSSDDVAEVMAFLRQHATALLGSTPDIFPVSARLAQDARRAMAGDEGVDLFERSRMGGLRDYLMRTLDDEGRTRLKLLSPLGVMQKLAVQYSEEAAKRQALWMRTRARSPISSSRWPSTPRRCAHRSSSGSKRSRASCSRCATAPTTSSTTPCAWRASPIWCAASGCASSSSVR